MMFDFFYCSGRPRVCQRVFHRSANFLLSLRISELGFCADAGVYGLDMSGVRFWNACEGEQC